MAHFNFDIPTNKAELLSHGDNYFVKDTFGPKEIVIKLKEASAQFREEGAEFILECFDVYYSVLHHSDTLSLDVIYKAYEDLHRAASALNNALGFILEDKESLNDELKLKYLNIMKMLLYVYTNIIVLIEQKNEVNNKKINVTGRKKFKENENFRIDKENVILRLNNIVQREITLFWDPPVAEEVFISMVSEVCYRFLQNPNVKAEKQLRLEIFNLIGTLIKDFNYGTTFVIRIVQLIKIHEHLVHCLPEGVQILVSNYNCKGIIHDLVREVTEWQTEEKYQDSQGARFCALVLSEMAVLMPDFMIPELMYLNSYLAYDSATLRNSVLNVITEVILNVLTKHELSDEEKEFRHDFFNILLEHMDDVSAFVRSKVIHHFARLQKENAIPIMHLHDILENVIVHLCDKGALVRKSAINCVTTFLSHNLFSSNLSLQKMQTELESKQKMLDTIKVQFEDVKMATLEKLEDDWKKRIDDLKKTIEEELEKEEEEEEEDCAIPNVEIPDLIRMYLNEGKYKDAFKLCKSSGKNIEEWQELKKSNENIKTEMYLVVLHSLFINIDKLIEEMKSGSIQGGVKMTEDDFKKMEALEAAVDFLNDSVKFLKLIDHSLASMTELLETTAIGDMQEAVEFFKTAYQFNIDNASVGVLAMLRIMQRNEQERKDLIVTAFKTMYLSTDSKNMKDHAITIVNRLIELLKSVPINNVDDLQLIISEWTSKGILDNSIIEMLWQYFTKKVDVSDDDSRAAVELLRMAAWGRKTVISRNIKLVATVAFKERGENSMLFLGSCCDLLAVAGQEKVDAEGERPPFKIKTDDEMFTDLTEILIKNFSEPVDYYYKALSGGIDVIYRLSSKPELLCENIITRVFNKLTKDLNGNNEQDLDRYIIVRLCQLLGCVAIRQLEFLDDPIHKELKRRNTIRELRKKNKKTDTEVKKKSKSGSKTNESTLNANLDESTLEGAQAEDSDADFILSVLENYTVTGADGLGQLSYIITGICQRPDVYDDVMIQGAAVIALIRFMLVSSKYCQEHIQLLFTIFEKTVYPEVKCSILVHLSDLLTRFPNIIEPWTPRIYQRLKDADDSIRKATFFTLSNLILRDMIRPHSHISEMAFCLVDDDQELSGMCKTFFVNLSHKENNLCHVLPDIFSHLMEIETMSEANVKRIMTIMFGLMDKSKHMENLVDRFCIKFKLSDDVRHQRNIAYCLSLIHYNEKALKKLHNNFPTYKHLVQDAEIYATFKTILQSCGKQQVGKADLKPIIAEIEQSINSVFELDENQGMKPPPIPKSTKKPKAKRTSAKKKQSKRRKSDYEDSDSD